jgi:hypothetical protein
MTQIDEAPEFKISESFAKLALIFEAFFTTALAWCLQII